MVAGQWENRNHGPAAATYLAMLDTDQLVGLRSYYNRDMQLFGYS